MAIRDEVLPVGPPVTLEWQIGRTRDIEQIRQAAENGEDVVLIDVRRTGKTTVALCAMELLLNAGHLVFVLDASENAPTSVDLAERLSRQLASFRSGSSSRPVAGRHSIRILHDIGTGATNFIEDEATRSGVDAILAAVRPASRSGVEQLDAVLDQIGVEAEQRERRAVVLIDEVQAIAQWDDGPALQAMLRARLAARANNPSFLFAGSEPTAMRTLFTPDGMLEFHGIQHTLSRIDDRDWHEGLARAFRALGCEVTVDAIDEVLLESGGHPERTMLVAREAHRIVQTSDTPDSVRRGHVVAGAEAAKRTYRWRSSENE
jgi:hypothetical protein